MSSYPFRILNTCNMSVLYLLNWSVGRPKVVSLMLYGSFRRSLDSFVALLWTPISFMQQSLNGDHTLKSKTEENITQITFGNQNLFSFKHILREYNKLKCFNSLSASKFISRLSNFYEKGYLFKLFISSSSIDIHC